MKLSVLIPVYNEERTLEDTLERTCAVCGARLTGLEIEAAREAARSLLSGLTLQHLFDHPLTDDLGKVDSVMRVNYDIDHGVFRGGRGRLAAVRVR